MKKFLFLFVGIIMLSVAANAQYKVNKTKYNYQDYVYEVGDPYNPTVAGVASFLVPGLGQMISGESGRGVAFLGGYIGCYVIYGIGAAATISSIDSYDDPSVSGGGLGLMTVGLLGAIAVDIWSTVDAVRVAKVNNMAFRDRNSSMNIELKPYINPSHYQMTGKNTLGLTMNITF